VNPRFFCLTEWRRLGHVISLCVVHTDRSNDPERLFGLDALGDGGELHGSTDSMYGGDHFSVDRIFSDVTNEASVDLEELN
jgi:hypothetical protein